ncbi:MAG: tyrosine-protein phosphatase [Anaerolineae bacterium]
MHEVYWVIPGLLAGRCGPDKVPWDPAQLYAGGIRVVVTAASEVPVEDLARFNLLHRRVRMTPLPWLWRRGQRRLVRQAHRILPFVHRKLEAGLPTLVHCHDGDDRTGVVLSGYLVTYLGMIPEQAVAQVRRANPRAMKMPGYARAVRWFTDGRPEHSPQRPRSSQG